MALIAGIMVTRRFGPIDQSVMLWLLLCAPAGIIYGLRRRKSVVLVIAVGALFMFLGCLLSARDLLIGAHFVPPPDIAIVHATVVDKLGASKQFRVFLVDSGVTVRDGTALPGRGRLVLKACGLPLKPGDRIAFRSRVSVPSNKGNPGEFDWELYCRNLGILWSAHVQGADSVVLISPGNRFLPRGLLYSLRERIEQFLDAQVPGNAGARHVTHGGESQSAFPLAAVGGEGQPPHSEKRKYEGSSVPRRLNFLSSREDIFRSAVPGVGNEPFFGCIEPTHPASGLHADRERSPRLFAAASSRLLQMRFDFFAWADEFAGSAALGVRNVPFFPCVELTHPALDLRADRGRWTPLLSTAPSLGLQLDDQPAFKERHAGHDTGIPTRSDIIAIVKGIVLGDRADISPAVNKSFVDSGLVHILSASGLHVGIAACAAIVAMWLLTWPFPVLYNWVPRKKLAAAASIPAMIAYCLLVGSRVATIRATLMGLVCAVAVISDRRWRSWNSLCVAALAILLLYPLSVTAVDFQLSFVAVAAIFVVLSATTGDSARGFWQDSDPGRRHRESRETESSSKVSCDSGIESSPDGATRTGDRQASLDVPTGSGGSARQAAIGESPDIPGNLGRESGEQPLSTQPTPRITTYLKARGYDVCVQWTFGVLLTSAAASLGVLPILLWVFHSIPVYAVAANLVAIPLFTLALPLSLASCLVGVWWPGAGSLLLWPAEHLIRCAVRWGMLIAGLPGSTIQVPEVSLFLLAAVVGICVIAAFLLHRKVTTRACVLLTAYAALAAAMLLIWSAGEASLWLRSTLRVTFLNVGKADAAFVEFPDGARMLVDAGRRMEDYDAGERYVLPALRWNAIRSLDWVMASHPDIDHTGGLLAVIKEIPTGALLWNPVPLRSGGLAAALAELTARNGRLLRADKDTPVLTVGRAKMTFLNDAWRAGLPGRGLGSSNNLSVVCRLEFGEVSFLFVGDLEHAGEQSLLATGRPLTATVLKVGHHGCKSSTSEEFVRAVSPQAALISADANLWSKCPDPRVISRLESAGARIFWTGRDGAVTMETDGNRLWVRTGKNSRAEEEVAVQRRSLQPREPSSSERYSVAP
ncbi:MAG: ComEC/Rec2 family competence protein [Thermodesulfobacteriota bacterium]